MIERQLLVQSFTNRLAFEMGQNVVALAKQKNLAIGVAVARLNHTVFLYLDDGMPADKHNWLRRKSNVAKHFEESSLAVKRDLAEKDMSLDGTFGLDEKDFTNSGGSIPIVAAATGLVGTITVTGLPDVDDHQLIVDALSGEFTFTR